VSWRALPGLWVEDFETHGRRLSAPGFVALAHHRLGAIAGHDPRPLVRRAGLALYHRLRQPVLLYGDVRLYHTTQIGRRVRFDGRLISLHPDAVVGDGCVLRAGVTLGTNSGPGAPRLGAGVDVGVKATIAGPVELGDGARVAPNSLVTRSVPAGGHVVGVPARLA
jgi:serine O-acetyltransferase